MDGAIPQKRQHSSQDTGFRWSGVYKSFEKHGPFAIMLFFLMFFLTQASRAVWNDAVKPMVSEVTAQVRTSATRIEQKMDMIEVQHNTLIRAVERLDRNQITANEILMRIEKDRSK